MIDRTAAGVLDMLIVGDVDLAEMRHAGDELSRIGRCRRVDTIPAAHRMLEDGAPPAWIGMLQCRPGRFSAHDVESLHAAAPLARLFLVVGSWSEGETRSGAPLPGVLRVPWHHLPFALLAERAAWEAGRPSPWALPRMARLVDRYAWAGVLSATPPYHVAIVADHREPFEAVGGMCRSLGWTTSWHRDIELACDAPGPLIWVWGAWSPREAERAAGWRRDAPSLVLADFPRVADCRPLHAAGWYVAGRPIEPDYLAAWAGRSANQDLI